MARVEPEDAVLYHVLQVGESPPDVPLVLHRVSPRARVPVPGEGEGGGEKRREEERVGYRRVGKEMAGPQREERRA